MSRVESHFVNDVLDKYGDLILLFTDSSTGYNDTYSLSLLADARSMMRVSDEWAHRILETGTCGRACHQHRVLALSGYFKIYQIFLNIMHGHFHLVPDTMEDLRVLFNIVTVGAELEALPLLRRWIGTWLKPHQH